MSRIKVSLFSQVLQLVDRQIFNRLVRNNEVDI